jgi:hypothetical protein
LVQQQKAGSVVTLGELNKAIIAYSAGLTAADAASAALQLRALGSFLGEFADEDLASLLKRGQRAAAPLRQAANLSPNSAIVKVAVQLEALATILKSAGGQSTFTQGLASLGRLLRAFGESDDLSAILDKLRDATKPEPIEQQIARFVERLKADARTPVFESTLAELEASALRREHVVAIAKSVYGGIRSSTSRKAALAFIRKPHDAYMSAKSGIDATGGRSAA